MSAMWDILYVGERDRQQAPSRTNQQQTSQKRKTCSPVEVFDVASGLGEVDDITSGVERAVLCNLMVMICLKKSHNQNKQNSQHWKDKPVPDIHRLARKSKGYSWTLLKKKARVKSITSDGQTSGKTWMFSFQGKTRHVGCHVVRVVQNRSCENSMPSKTFWVLLKLVERNIESQMVVWAVTCAKITYQWR